jgi:K+-sensing histidine kinase KdpD
MNATGYFFVIITILVGMVMLGVWYLRARGSKTNAVAPRSLPELERRAEELERRLMHMRTAAGISSAVISVPDPQNHIQRFIDLIHERFNLSWVGVSLADETGQLVTAQAGEPAKKTRSEITLPLINAGRKLGTLTIQSAAAQVFDQEDIAIFQGLTDSLAAALEKARLLQQVQANVDGLKRGMAELERSERIQAALYKIADIASVAEDMNEFYETIHQIVGGLMWAKNFYVALYDEKTRMLSFPFVVDEVDSVQIPTQSLQEFGKGLTTYVLRTGEPLLASPEKFDELVAAGEVELIGVRPVDWLGAPLKIGTRTLGILAVQSYSQTIRFGEKEKDLLTFVSQHIAIALDRARQLGAAREHLAELAIITSLTQTLASKLNLNAVVNLVGEKIREIFDAQVVFIALYDRQTQMIDFPYFLVNDGLIQGEKLPLGKGLTSVVIQTREPLVINHDYARRAVELGAHQVAEKPPKSWLGVPIVVRGEVNGVISLQNLERENSFSDADVRLLTTMGESMWVAIENSRLYEKVQQELIDRMRAEKEIRRLNAELEERVTKRTAQLEATNKELESFSYSVSHDLRAPLRAIDGFSRIVLEEYADRIDVEGKGYLERVRAASKQMGQLIDDMLRLSRVTRSDMRRVTVDLSAIVRVVADDLSTAQPGRQVEFVINPAVTANADHNLMRIVFENLIGNAWKFTQKHASARIEFGATQNNGKTAYFIRDDGAGFNMAHVHRLFGPFQRLHATNEFEGTGIGLATVQRIIYRHGGRLWAEGAIEKGATFYFTLEGE